MYTAKRHLTMLYSNISNLCRSHQIFWPWYQALDGLRWPFQRPDIDIGDHEKPYRLTEKHWNENRPGLNHIASRDQIFCWILRSKLSFACIFDMQKVLCCDLEKKNTLSVLGMWSQQNTDLVSSNSNERPSSKSWKMTIKNLKLAAYFQTDIVSIFSG